MASNNYWYILLLLPFALITASFNQTVSDEEINELVKQLLAADDNRARSNHITVNYQNYTSSRTQVDTSREK